MTDTVESLATELSRAFERRKREYGQHEPGLDHYTALKDGSPDWMKAACRAAHDAGGDLMMPDDWRYEFIEDAANALADHEGDEERARESLNESDHYCYTSQQTGWLHSHNGRQGYVDEAVSSGLVDGSEVTRAIRVGMLLEQEEVLAALYRFLDNLADESDEEEEADRYNCRHCGSSVERAYAADSPGAHQGAEGTDDDPRSPGDHTECCDLCCYGDEARCARRG